ncbi:hypothetical protein BDZ89DRAFT_1041768 [Hymenopellis radicata]|nr:hypothetical protein BDZ89DRAFT_1041768 [Hymenopellis radicata]
MSFDGKEWRTTRHGDDHRPSRRRPSFKDGTPSMILYCQRRLYICLLNVHVLAVSSLWTVAMTTLPSYECARDVLQDQTDTAPSSSSSLYNHHRPSPPPTSPLFSLNEHVDRNRDRDTYCATHSTIWWGELHEEYAKQVSASPSTQHATTLSSAEHPGASKMIIFPPTTKKTQLLAAFLRNLHSKAFSQPDVLEDSSLELRVPLHSSSLPTVCPWRRLPQPYTRRPSRYSLEVESLTDIPLKTYTTKQLDDSVEQLAAKPDENVRQHRDWEAYQHPVQPLVEIKVLTRRIDPAAPLDG